MMIRGVSAGETDSLEVLDPYERLYMTQLPGYYCMAAFEDDDDGESIPAGAILFGVLKKSITIEWLYVEQEFRYRNIGERLLNIAYDMAITKKTGELYAYISDSKKMQRRLPGRKSYFSDRYFERSIDVPGEWHTELLDFLSVQKGIGADQALADSVIPFSELTTAQVRTIIEATADRRDAEHLCDFSPADIDMGCSVSLGTADDGAAVFMDAGGDIILVGFYAKNIAVAEALFSKAAFFLAKSKKPDVMLHIIMRNKNNKAVLDRISDGGYAPGRLLMADVAMYIGALEMDVMVGYDFMDALDASEK